MPSSFLVALLSSFIATLGLGAQLLGVPRKSGHQHPRTGG